MIAVKPHAEGSILPVWAKPGAKADALLDEREGALVVAIKAPPVDGKANEAIIDVLSESLNWKRSRIRLVSGDSSRTKRFLIAGLGPDDLLARIDAALTPTMFEPQDPEL
jgi:uncharacterized protein (TIGR00251 family)